MKIEKLFPIFKYISDLFVGVLCATGDVLSQVLVERFVQNLAQRISILSSSSTYAYEFT